MRDSWECINLEPNKGHRKVVIRVDCKEVYNAPIKENYKTREGPSLLRRVKSTMNQDLKIHMVHVYHEATKCVNVFARLGVNHRYGIIYYNDCLQELYETYLAV